MRTFVPTAAAASLLFLGACATMTVKVPDSPSDETRSQLKGGLAAAGGVEDPTLKLPEADLAWWKDAKFGLFIHWGLYAIPARGEWVMHNEKIPAEAYAKLADEFHPRNYDPSRWAEAAQVAGMRYMVLTARHHDGFALWDSPGSWGRFDAVSHAAKRDLVRPYVEAARAAGLRVGLYYSPMDWRFPGYFKPRELAENALLMKKQGYAQVEELVSNYGKLDILWYDGGWLAHQGSDADAAWFWEPVKLNRMVRAHQPKVVISPRSGWIGDFKTDEGEQAVKGPIHPGAWEKCFSLHGAWGYVNPPVVMGRDAVLNHLVNTWIRGGNVLLNVGPDRDGVIPPAELARLQEIGAWVKPRAAAIFGTRPGPWQPVDGVYGSTQAGNKGYLYVLQWPDNGAALSLPAPSGRISAARVIPSGEAVWTQEGGALRISVEAKDRDPVATIVELTLQ